jgi:hypothetical protein
MNLKTTLLFLALVVPLTTGRLAAADESSGADYALVMDVYSGAVPPAAIQEKKLWSGLESLENGREPNGPGFPRSSILTMCSRRKISVSPNRLKRMDRRSLSRVM